MTIVHDSGLELLSVIQRLREENRQLRDQIEAISRRCASLEDDLALVPELVREAERLIAEEKAARLRDRLLVRDAEQIIAEEKAARMRDRPRQPLSA